MTTRVDMASRIRAELNEAGPAYVWSSQLLYQWLGEGLQQLALDLPTLKSVSLTIGAGQRQFSLVGLGLGPQGVKAVEYPDGYVLPEGEARAQNDGAMTIGQLYQNCWELVWRPNDTPEIWLRYSLVGSQPTLTVWLYPIYAAPASDSDGLDVAAFDENLLVWFVCGRALGWLEEQRGKRGPVSGGQGSGASARYYERRYTSGIAARRRARGVKVGRLWNEA